VQSDLRQTWKCSPYRPASISKRKHAAATAPINHSPSRPSYGGSTGLAGFFFSGSAKGQDPLKSFYGESTATLHAHASRDASCESETGGGSSTAPRHAGTGSPHNVMGYDINSYLFHICSNLLL